MHDELTATKGNYTRMDELEDEMRDSYDETVLKNGVRGKYYQRYRATQNLAQLTPDIRAAFPTDEEVNRVLQALMDSKSSEKMLSYKSK